MLPIPQAPSFVLSRSQCKTAGHLFLVGWWPYPWWSPLASHHSILQAVTLCDVFMNDEVYSDPTNWNASMITTSAAAFGGMPPAFLDDLDDDVIYDSILNGDFSSVKFTQESVSYCTVLVKSFAHLNGIFFLASLEAIGKLWKWWTVYSGVLHTTPCSNPPAGGSQESHNTKCAKPLTSTVHKTA